MLWTRKLVSVHCEKVLSEQEGLRMGNAYLVRDGVLGVLELFKVLPHVGIIPLLIAGDVTNVVEVVLAGKQTDQGVMLGAATETTVARVEVTQDS
jgi:hypothetical protein